MAASIKKLFYKSSFFGSKTQYFGQSLKKKIPNPLLDEELKQYFEEKFKTRIT